MIPISRAKEKSWMTEPPRKKRASSTMPVVSERTTVRLKTWLMLRLIIGSSE